MIVSFSFCKTVHGDFLLCLCAALCLTAARSSDDRITIKKVRADPVFLTVGRTLRLKLDIEDLQVDKWNTTAFWVKASDYSLSSEERELQWIRQIGSSSEIYYSYNTTRISRERQIDLVLSKVSLADSGIYRCKFRRPPDAWSAWIHYNVVVEEEGADFQGDVPPIYVTSGDTLKLEPNLPDSVASSYGENYETFWDFSSKLASSEEEAVRIIGLTRSSMENMDERASLGENGTALMLRNTTENDSGIYHLRMLKELSTTAIHKDFNVVVEARPIANMRCPSIVRLSEGESFFCLCEDVSKSEVIGQAIWLQDGQTIKHLRPFHEEELYLQNVTAREAGFYTCRVHTITKVVELTLQVLVFPAKQETKGNKTTKRLYTWYLLAGSVFAGLVLGVALVYIVQSVRGKRRKGRDVYEDVRSNNLELDVTSQYQDMSRDRPHYQEADTNFCHYEVADLACGIYLDMNQGRPLHQTDITLNPGYTDLDHRSRVDSHPYQDLKPNKLPGNRV